MNKKDKISILGDSISTYEGVSNNPNYNQTLLNNKVYYKDPFKKEDTWWFKTITELNLRLIVNNSYSGSSVSDIRTDPLKGKAYLNRAINLHNNENMSPDIILVYLGVNDLMDGASCKNLFNESYFDKISNNDFKPTTNNFDEAFSLLLYRINKTYPNSKIYCLNIPLMKCNTEETCSLYNNTITLIANHYKAEIIDLYHSNISNYQKYTLDGVHPNIDGMKEMAHIVINYLKKEITKNEDKK